MAIENLVHSLGREQVVAIRYGAWSSDNYNINNPLDNNARVTYYGMGTGTPRAWVDGIHHMVGSNQIPAQVGNFTNSRLPIPSPYELEISGNYTNNSVTVKVKTTDTPPSGNKYLRIAMIEKEYDWPTAPGTNGQTHYENSLLDMVPDAQGTLINIAVGDSQTFTFNYNQSQVNFHPPSSLSALLAVVAFIQNDQSREILQAAYGEAGINIGTISSNAIIQSTINIALQGYLYNQSGGQIDLDLAISGQIPAGWNISATCSQGSIPVNGGNLTVTLAGNDSLLYTIHVDPMGISGGVVLDADISLLSNPAFLNNSKFFVTTDDVDILIVDAGTENNGILIENSLTNFFNGTYGYVPRDVLHSPAINLDSIAHIAWTSGNSLPVFYPEEISTLQNFLDNGGNLLITGQDIGNDIFGTGATSQHAQGFYNNYLHASFVGNNASWLIINGYGGDPISDGISFSGNDIYPRSYDKVAPYDAQATPIFKYYNGPDIAGVRAESGNYRVVYMGLAFEQITDAVDRDSILARTIRWFNDKPVGIEDDPQMVYTFQLAQNYPNPFNPETTIKYSLDNTAAEQTTLFIYNSLGQVVKRLVNAPQSAGSYEVPWTGTDDYGNSVASGIYYYQLKSGQNSSVQKMILIR